MSNVDWATAPEDAEFYCNGSFRKLDPSCPEGQLLAWSTSDKIWEVGGYTLQEAKWNNHYSERPIFDGITQQKHLEQAISNLTSTMLLAEVNSIQQQRAAEYEQDRGERSFAKITTVFNTYTGKDLLPSDIALIFEILKNVRFYAQNGLHRDSVIDKISYASLWGELVMEERT